jgi:tRNA(fMet)-specific endonuclease VapC
MALNYFIDTSELINFLRGRKTNFYNLVEKEENHFFVNTIVKVELLFGAYKYKPSELKTIENLLSKLEILEISSQITADIFLNLKLQTSGGGFTIGDNDLWIASSCLEHHLTLLTHNKKDFANIPNLKLL